MRDCDLELVEGIEDIGRKIAYEKWLVGSRINITSGATILIIALGICFVPGVWAVITSGGWKIFAAGFAPAIGLLYLGVGISQRRTILERIKHEKL